LNSIPTLVDVWVYEIVIARPSHCLGLAIIVFPLDGTSSYLAWCLCMIWACAYRYDFPDEPVTW